MTHLETLAPDGRFTAFNALRFARELDFHEPLYRASDPKLQNSPFEQGFGDVTEFPAFSLGYAFELPAQFLADTHTYLSLPFTHALSVSKTALVRKNKPNWSRFRPQKGKGP